MWQDRNAQEVPSKVYLVPSTLNSTEPNQILHYLLQRPKHGQFHQILRRQEGLSSDYSSNKRQNWYGQEGFSPHHAIVRLSRGGQFRKKHQLTNSMLHNLIVLSSDADARYSPSLVQAISETPSVCPLNVWMNWPVFPSHNFMTPSAPSLEIYSG